MKAFIIKYWKGEGKLWKVFWIWNILIPFIASFIEQAVIIIHVYFMTDIQLNNPLMYRVLIRSAVIVLSLFSFAYFIWSLVSLWRSAFNCSNRFFGYLARVWVVGVLIVSAGFLVQKTLFPNLIFDDSRGDIILNPDQFHMEQKVPDDSAWQKVTIGLSMEEAEKILGKPGSSTIFDSGLSAWSYWSYKYDKNDDPMLIWFPSGKIYNVLRLFN